MFYHQNQCPRAPKTSKVEWQRGDIAFLKHYNQYSPQDYTDLIVSGHLHKDATVHPVILLAVQNNKAIITPVSAFRTEEQNFRPPWAQKWHRSKRRAAFRAFEGTQRPNANQAALRLAESSMKMPKPQASWVYLQNFYCVPLSVLGWFNKSPTLLRVHPDSLKELELAIRTDFPLEYQDAGVRLKGPAFTSSGTPTATIKNAPAPKAAAAASTLALAPNKYCRNSSGSPFPGSNWAHVARSQAPSVPSIRAQGMRVA